MQFDETVVSTAKCVLPWSHCLRHACYFCIMHGLCIFVCQLCNSALRSALSMNSL